MYVQVPEGDYEVELGVGKIMREGSDVTLVGWGAQVHVLMKVRKVVMYCMYVLYVCMYVCMYACMYVCMYVIVNRTGYFSQASELAMKQFGISCEVRLTMLSSVLNMYVCMYVCMYDCYMYLQ